MPYSNKGFLCLGFPFLLILLFCSSNLQATDTPTIFDKGMQVLESEGPKAALTFFQECRQDPKYKDWCEYGEAYVLRLRGNLEASQQMLAELEADEIPSSLRSLVTYSQATNFMNLQAFDEARKALDQSQAISEQARDQKGIYNCLLLRANISLHQGKIDEAETQLNQAAVYSQNLETRPMYRLYLQSYVSLKKGETKYALACVKNAHKDYRATGQTFFQSILSTTECILLLSLDQKEDAFSALGRAISEHEVSNYRHPFLKNLHTYISGTIFEVPSESFDAEALVSNMEAYLQKQPNYYFADLLMMLRK